MGNILNHNRRILDFDLIKNDYWDFHICLDNSGGTYRGGLTERCLASFVNFADDECVWLDNAYSYKQYKWSAAVNTNDLVLENFGYTSVDNGRTYYDVDRISNKEFLEIFTNTKYSPEEDDTRLVLAKVRGNHKLYDYSNDLVYEDDEQCAKLNGGWWQGFFSANDGSQYKVLPSDIGTGWTLEFVLKKKDFENEAKTLNSVYPENKGIFFYIGTRAENKWWKYYKTEHEFDYCNKNGFADDYVTPEYIGDSNLNANYFALLVGAEYNHEYFSDDYVDYEDKEPEEISEECQKYVEDDYFEPEVEIDKDDDIKTAEGYDMYQPNVGQIISDNKFLYFDRTPDGMTVDKWDEENAEYIFNYIKRPQMPNFFTLFNRTKDGYTVDTIEDVIIAEQKKYNVLSDVYRNAFALQIKDDGTLGYKYMVQDCEAEVENYKILSEFTKIPVVTEDEWLDVIVKFIPINHKDKSLYKCAEGLNSSAEKMRLLMYINGKLVLVSKELPILNLRKLNDIEGKQEGVPFNISLGGGTQGLAETVTLDYRSYPDYVLPLEKEFGGSFVGFMKLFRFYECQLNFDEITNNAKLVFV